MSTYTVYASMAEDVRKKLNALAKKAATYKVPFSFTESAEHPQTVRVMTVGPDCRTAEQVNTYTVAAVDFDVECEGLIRANGWSVRAKIEHGEQGNIVTGFGDKPVDESWYKAPAKCEHCKTNRFRSVTYFCENEAGALKQVGSSCLHDYTGISPATATMWAEVMDLFADGMDCSSSEWEEHRSSRMYDVETVLAHAHDSIKAFGYRKSSDPGSTRDDVSVRVHDGMKPSTEGFENAKKVIEWMSERKKKADADDETLNALRMADGDEPDDPSAEYWSKLYELRNKWDAVSDLERNCLPLIASGYAKPYHFGRLVYLPVAYENYLNRKAEAEKSEAERQAAAETSEYVGEVKQRLTIKMSSAKLVTSWETYWGTTFLYKFTDENGNVYVWYASRSIDVVDGMTLRGTVKDHSEYQGVKQTVLTNCCKVA